MYQTELDKNAKRVKSAMKHNGNVRNGQFPESIQRHFAQGPSVPYHVYSWHLDNIQYGSYDIITYDYSLSPPPPPPKEQNGDPFRPYSSGTPDSRTTHPPSNP